MRVGNRIAVAQRLQPCLHFIDGMDITLQDLLRQWLCYLTIVFLLRTSAILEQAQMALGLASVILMFLIGGVMSGIKVSLLLFISVIPH